MMRNIRVKTERLWQSLMDMAEIGALPNGGCRRLALTDEDKEGRDLFVHWCKEAGCTISIDRMGNIFARRPGRNNDCLLYTSPSPRDQRGSRMPSSA